MTRDTGKLLALGKSLKLIVNLNFHSYQSEVFYVFRREEINVSQRFIFSESNRLIWLEKLYCSRRGSQF